MLAGLAAFPLTPLADGRLDEGAFAGLVGRLAASGVDAIGALGSTGSYAYLDRGERARAAGLAVEHADATPVLVGIGALRTRDVLACADDAQAAGAAGLLLAPVSYQPLTAEEVLRLFEDVAREASVPLVVYDNPTTTRFAFDDELLGAICALPGVEGVKIPPVPLDAAAAAARIATLRAALPAGIAIAVSGDASAASGLAAGCDAWHSVLAGTLPAPCLRLIRAPRDGGRDAAVRASSALDPIWRLFAAYGSLRVVAAIAEELGLAGPACLPRPLLGLDGPARAAVRAALEEIDAFDGIEGHEGMKGHDEDEGLAERDASDGPDGLDGPAGFARPAASDA